MKNVVVTGATGFIGNSLVYNLACKGITVYAVVRNLIKAENFKGNNNIIVIECDMSEIDKLSERLSGVCIDTFYHFAWAGTSGDSRMDYNLQLDNVKYTCECVKTAKKIGCKKFIFAGSLMEYESIKYVPVSGSTPALNYIYRTAKLTAHYMTKALAVDLNLDYICATISNVYGEGELSPRLINSTLRKLINGEKTVFTSGEQLYDFIYISDAINAFITIGENGKKFSNYYIGNKKPRPLKEFLIEMRDCVNKDIELGLGELPFDGVNLDFTEFDTMTLYHETNFQCKVTFKEGIKKTIEWIKIQDL